MPYIAIATSKSLTKEQKTALKTKLGEKISIIPGKAEDRLMVDISENHDMYFKGVERELAFVDVKCYGETEMEYKKAFTEAAFEVLQKETGLPQDSIYLTFTDYKNWGTLGSLK